MSDDSILEMGIDVEAWLSSRAVMIMTPAQRGAYFQLLAIAWCEKDGSCSLPDDDKTLARLSGLGANWKKAGKLVRDQFIPVPNRPGFIFNKKLGDTKSEQLKRVSVSRNQKVQAANARWTKEREKAESLENSKADECGRKADADQPQSGSNASLSSSYPSSSSSAPKRDITRDGFENYPSAEGSHPDASEIEPPFTRQEFDNLCDIRGIPADCAEWAWNSFAGNSWKTKMGQHVTSLNQVGPLMTNILNTWRPNQHKDRSRSDRKTPNPEPTPRKNTV